MLDVLITLDTTGSMNPVAHETRQKVQQLTEVLFKENNVRIAIISHGDYCDFPNIYSKLDFTDDPFEVQQFVQHKMPKTDGGDFAECYEAIYELANGMDWRIDATKILVQFSDADPHEPNYNAERYMKGHMYKVPDWRNELSELKRKGVTVYALQCLSKHQTNYYKYISRLFNLNPLFLSNFNDAVNSILLVALHASNRQSFDNYVEDLQLNVGLANLIDSLLGEGLNYGLKVENAATELRHKSFKTLADGLVPVKSDRFQLLTIDENKSIKDFVESTGAIFKIGKGFYQLSKAETIQESKEVVLVDSFGNYFSGTQAREMLGVPLGKRGRVYKSDIPAGYDVYIQSTSVNRKLVKGTKFLYEAV